jgi:biopolymer transport protein ExbD
VAGIIDDDEDVIATINMVPFIDISLVLLIIFLVTSSYIVRQAIEVELPTAASASEVVPDSLAIVIARDGSLALDGRVVSERALEQEIRERVSADPEIRAIIAGDRGVDYGAVVDVVDIVKLAGVRTFALNVERESPTGQ